MSFTLNEIDMTQTQIWWRGCFGLCSNKRELLTSKSSHKLDPRGYIWRWFQKYIDIIVVVTYGFHIYIAVLLTFISYKEKQLDYNTTYEWNGIFSFVLCMPMCRNTHKP